VEIRRGGKFSSRKLKNEQGGRKEGSSKKASQKKKGYSNQGEEGSNQEMGRGVTFPYARRTSGRKIIKRKKGV